MQDLQNNGKITIHPNLREIKNRFNLKHQNKQPTPPLKEAANQ